MAEVSPRRIRRALLFVNPHKPRAPALAEEISRELRRLSAEVCTYPFDPPPDGSGAGDPGPDVPAASSPDDGLGDLAFSLGGDGTVLYAARIAAPRGLPILPINAGTLGFIAAVRPGDWLRVFQDWLSGEAGISRRLMLEAVVERRGKTLTSRVFLNEAVIAASGIAKIIRLRVESEIPAPHEYMQLGHYRSDGLIVATPTGSTAYSAAAGGPILDPEVEALIINPICPFTLSNRPMVIPANEGVIVTVEPGGGSNLSGADQNLNQNRSGGVLLTLDGQLMEPLEPGDKVMIRRANCQAQLIACGREAFYKALRTKLNWPGEAVEEAGA